MTLEVAGSGFGKTWRWTRKLILLEYDDLPSTPIHSSLQSCILCWNLSSTQIIAQMTGDGLDRPEQTVSPIPQLYAKIIIGEKSPAWSFQLGGKTPSCIRSNNFYR